MIQGRFRVDPSKIYVAVWGSRLYPQWFRGAGGLFVRRPFGGDCAISMLLWGCIGVLFLGYDLKGTTLDPVRCSKIPTAVDSWGFELVPKVGPSTALGDIEQE